MPRKDSKWVETLTLSIGTIAAWLGVAAGVILLGYQCLERFRSCVWVSYPLSKVTGLSADGLHPGFLHSVAAFLLDLPTSGTLIFAPYILIVGIVKLYDRIRFG